MANKYVRNALPLAEKVAHEILDKSYRRGLPDPNENFQRDNPVSFSSGVYDVLLFGSTLKSKDAKKSPCKSPHDIDILVIHDLYELSKCGLITKYDDEERRCVPDLKPEHTMEDGVCSATGILNYMGSKIHDDLLETDFAVTRSIREQIWNIRVTGVDKPYYEGKLEHNYIGTVNIKKTEDLRDVLKEVDRAFDREVKSKSVIANIENLFKRRIPKINDVLDLHAMHVSFLNPNLAEEEREIAIKQCADQTFWYTVLDSGRLYDFNSGKFTIPITDRYPEALEAFTIDGN